MDRKEIIEISVFLFLAGCISAPSSSTSPNSTSQQNQTDLINLSYAKCLNDSGAYKLLSGPSGQYGLCLFPDGSVCDALAYYRGDCYKAQCNRTCEYKGTINEGWYDCHGKLLFWDNCTNESAATAGTC